jgi:hypothetical protein
MSCRAVEGGVNVYQGYVADLANFGALLVLRVPVAPAQSTATQRDWVCRLGDRCHSVTTLPAVVLDVVPLTVR